MSGDGESASLVVIGSSAGGVEALAHLAALLPNDFPAPVIIAQHADPKRSGRLAEILQRQTKLHIDTVQRDDDALQPGRIYLAAAGRNLAVKSDRIYSTERLQSHPVPSIDMLFTTAAQAYGERVVAVILTGTGTDGVAGVRAVKEFGGTVVVQDIGSAAYPSLPAAIPTHYVDFTSTIDELPSLLTTLASPVDGQLGTDAGLEAFLAQVRGRSGIDFRQYKMPTIRRRLMRLMAATGCNTLADYLRYLNMHADAYQQLISSFLIKVTGFFRDPSTFRYLREHVLPELVAVARDHNWSELRTWSAGCATGEEAYSLAILLAELLGDDIEKLPVRIFATDLDTHAIDFARRGIYPEAAFEEMPAELVTKYFTRVGDAYQIKKQIRNLTVFGEYDLGARAPFPRIDLVMCRNVLIYFTKELQQRTLQLFAFSLRQRGFLVLGKAETTSPLPQYFSPVDASVKVYRRQGERLLVPTPVGDLRVPVPERSPGRSTARRSEPVRLTQDEAPPPPRWSLADRLGAFLFESDIGVVVVDRRYDIITINQAARSLLGIASQGIGNDLIHLARVPSADLKGMLDAALRGELPSISMETSISDPGQEEERYLTISCYPDRLANKEGRTEGVIVIVSDSTRIGKRQRYLEKEFTETRGAVERLTLRNAELIERHQVLMQANSELNGANVDLRNANDHLLISAEEAEASAEEVETLNEELQATSEELETLNEELHATIEELNTTNEELAARSDALERTARQSQDQLDNANAALATLCAVVDNVPLIVCIVDRQATVTLASQRYSKLAKLNHDVLPGVGDQWQMGSDTVTLRENKSESAYVVSRITLPQNGGAALVLLTPR